MKVKFRSEEGDRKTRTTCTLAHMRFRGFLELLAAVDDDNKTQRERQSRESQTPFNSKEASTTVIVTFNLAVVHFVLASLKTDMKYVVRLKTYV